MLDANDLDIGDVTNDHAWRNVDALDKYATIDEW